MNIQTASAPRTSNIHSRCGKPFAKNVNSLRSDRTFFAHSTSFVHVEVLRLVQIVWIVHTISFRAEFHNCPYKNPRTFRVSINGNKYNGHIVKYTQTPFPLEKRDMILTAENPLFVRQNESLMYLYSNGARISFESQFCDLDLKSMSSEYGYIGKKDDCLYFINKARNSRYYSTNDTKTIIRYRNIDFDKHPPKYHWMPPYSYVDYSEEKK